MEKCRGDRQTSWSSSRSFCPPGCSRCEMIWGRFLCGDGFSMPEHPRAGLDASSERLFQQRAEPRLRVLSRRLFGCCLQSFPERSQAAPCLVLSRASFVTRQQITKLPLPSEEPGPHAGASRGTGARSVPALRPVPTGFGHGDLKPVAPPHTSSPSHRQLFQGNPHPSSHAPGSTSTAFSIIFAFPM